jgi:pimeloyl-ACP methyl ester carboxylesterase
MDKKGALRLAQNFGNIKCAIIDKAGHQLNFENPDGVLRTLYQSYLEIVLKE